MTTVQACDLPAGALLGKHLKQGAYTDCYFTGVAIPVSHRQYVEARGLDQLLLCDFLGHTRSWLMSVPVQASETSCTRLYFGSAVVPVAPIPAGKPGIGGGLPCADGLSQVLLAGTPARRDFAAGMSGSGREVSGVF